MTKKKSDLKKWFKEQWIEGLLSGEYIQITNKLRVGLDDFCALGVACDMIIARRGKREWPKDLVNRSLMPVEYRKFVGLSPTNMDKIIHMNDQKKRTFPQIAAYIKRYL